MSAFDTGRPMWSTVAVAATAALFIVALAIAGDGVAPSVVMWTGITATTLCTLGSLGVIWLGWRSALAEIAITGVVLLTVPLLQLAGTLSTQGFLAARDGAAPVVAAVAVPLGALACVPLVLSDNRLRSWASRRWRAWTGTWLGTVISLAVVLLWTSLRPPLPAAAVLSTAALAGASVFAGIGWRHLSLYRVGRQGVSLLVGATFMALGAAGLLARGLEIPPSLELATMGVDIALSFTAIAGMALLSGRLRSVPAVMAPVTTRDPLVALRLGLDPTVLAFVARVGDKDASTQQHIIRVGELATRVGVRAGIRGAKLRELGIGALLHDIGKLVVPDEILRKPGALTDDEFEIIKQHASAGERLLASSPLLAGSARYVRWHHERPDGTGYPDGLSGDEIPLDVALLSVCDAYDAMTQDRHYRTAMTSQRALEILAEHTGTQFDPAALQLLRAELAASPELTTVFASLGDTATDDSQSTCAHALPGGYLSHHGF